MAETLSAFGAHPERRMETQTSAVRVNRMG